MAGDFEKLAYEEAVRGLDKQEGLLEALRTRTGVLIAASFLAASLLGQQIVTHVGPQGFVVVALLAFLASLGGGVVILLPKRDLVFATGGVDCYAGLYEIRGDMAEVYRRLAYELDRLWDSNNNEIRQLSRIFTLSAGALVVEILSWVASLGGSII
jgi:hypothetical protein